MKLSPPASSSDLEVARAIARRLHLRARGQESSQLPEAAEVEIPLADSGTPLADEGGVAPEAPAALFEPAPPEPPPITPPPIEPEAPEPPPPTDSAAPEHSPFEPVAPEPPPIEPPALAPPPLPEPDEVAAAASPFDGESLPGELPEISESPGDAMTAAEVPPPEAPLGALDGAPSETTAPSDERPQAVSPSDEIDADSALADLGPPPAGPTLEDLEPPGGPVSPEDLVEAPAGQDWEEDTPLQAQLAGEQTPEDLVAGPSPPSWESIADSCLALTRAHGAMLVDPAGQVLTARGSWPEPGPEAIGARLVSMMEKTLQDAPTRSVSAPLAGQHLTAWRVPMSEGFLTIVFMGEAPLGADMRGPVDGEVKQALGL